VLCLLLRIYLGKRRQINILVAIATTWLALNAVLTPFVNFMMSNMSSLKSTLAQ
jgi:hypothetical protein